MLHGSKSHPLRALGALFALALFLGGTNLCTVSRVAEALGTRVPMACASAGLAAPGGDADAPCPMHCGHAAAPRAPRAPAPAPCCLALLPVSAPDVVAHAGPAVHVVAPAAPALVLDDAATTRLTAPADPDPPAAPPRAPLSARAPPLL